MVPLEGHSHQPPGTLPCCPGSLVNSLCHFKPSSLSPVFKPSPLPPHNTVVLRWKLPQLAAPQPTSPLPSIPPPLIPSYKPPHLCSGPHLLAPPQDPYSIHHPFRSCISNSVPDPPISAESCAKVSYKIQEKKERTRTALPRAHIPST